MSTGCQHLLFVTHATVPTQCRNSHQRHGSATAEYRCQRCGENLCRECAMLTKMQQADQEPPAYRIAQAMRVLSDTGMEKLGQNPTAVAFTAQMLEWGYDAETLTVALIKAHEKAQRSVGRLIDQKQMYTTHVGDQTQSHAQAVFMHQLLEAILDPVWNNRTLAHAESHAQRVVQNMAHVREADRVLNDVHRALTMAHRQNRKGT